MWHLETPISPSPIKQVNCPLTPPARQGGAGRQQREEQRCRAGWKQINQPAGVRTARLEVERLSWITRALKWCTWTTPVFHTTAWVISGTCGILFKMQMPHQAAEGARGEEQKRCLEVEKVEIAMVLCDFLSPVKFHPTALVLSDSSALLQQYASTHLLPAPQWNQWNNFLLN